MGGGYIYGVGAGKTRWVCMQGDKSCLPLVYLDEGRNPTGWTDAPPQSLNLFRAFNNGHRRLALYGGMLFPPLSCFLFPARFFVAWCGD